MPERDPGLPTRPVPKPPFLPDGRLRVRRLGPPTGDGLTVYAFFDVLDELLYSSNYHRNQAAAGVLVGGYYRGPAGDYVEVRGYTDLQVIESTLEYADRLDRDWAHLNAPSAMTEAGLRPLGWFLSRAESRAQATPFESLVHLSYFNLPFHVFLMIDPASRLAGLYLSGGGDRLRNVGFNVIEPHPATAAEAERDPD